MAFPLSWNTTLSPFRENLTELSRFVLPISIYDREFVVIVSYLIKARALLVNTVWLRTSRYESSSINYFARDSLPLVLSLWSMKHSL